MKYREDLRHLYVCSVDPPGCTDIDDALHCREIENGNLEVGWVFCLLICFSKQSVVIIAIDASKTVGLLWKKLMVCTADNEWDGHEET